MSDPLPLRGGRHTRDRNPSADGETPSAKALQLRRQHHAPSANEGHFLDYVRIAYKRRWTVLTAFVLVCGWMAIYTSTLMPVYTARVQLLIENETPNVVKFEQVYEENKTTNDYYQTQYKLLQSRLVARRTIESEKLWDHPLLRATQATA